MKTKNVPGGLWTSFPVLLTSMLLAFAGLQPAYASPDILGGPTNQTVTAGGTAAFSVTVTGEAPLSYQWYFNNAGILGATNSTLTLNNVQPGEAGAYYAAVTNADGSAISATATLTVNATFPPEAPYIITEPTSQMATTGGTAAFSVNAVGGAPLSYQWYLNGTNVWGATNATLALSDVNEADAGAYYVTVADAYGSVTSPMVALTVAPNLLPPPSQAPYVITQPANQTVAVGSTATFSVMAGGTAPLSYSWIFDGTNLVGTNATLILDDVSPANAGLYQVFIENAYGSTDSIPVTLTVNSSGPSQAPYIITPPANQTVTEGGTATFSVTAGGTAPLSYDWIFNGTNVVGTNATLVLDDVASADAGVYQVFIENAYGSTDSIPVTLTVNSSGPSQAPYIISQPANQTVADGGTATFSVTAGGTAPLSYDWIFNGTNSVGTNATLVLDDVTPVDAGVYQVFIVNAYGSTNSYPATLTVSSSSSCDPVPSGIISWWPGEGNANDVIGTNNGILENGVTFTEGVVGEAFHFNGSNQDVQIPYSTSLEPANITVECWVKLDALASPVAAYPGLQYIVFKQNSRGGDFEGYDLEKNRINGQDVFRFQVTSVDGEQVPAASTTIPQPGVWYHLAGTYDGTNVNIYVNGVLEGTAVAGFPMDYGTEPVYFGTTGQGFDGRLEGSLDEVSIYNRVLSSSEIAAIYQAGSDGKCPPNPSMAPYIIGQPVNQTVSEGGTATFSVTAGGAAPLSYEWLFHGTNLVVGTNATLVLDDVTSADAGVYQVFIENAYGSTDSVPVTLTVNSSGPSQVPYIITPPANQTVTEGGTATFSVTAGGTAPLSYDWIFNGTNSVGTNATLVLDDVSPADAGVYQVFIRNAYGLTNSGPVTLTVNSSGPSQAPYIISQPPNQTVTEGGTATFSVTAGGTAPLSYNWIFNGTNSVGTNSTLVLDDVTPADAGVYQVFIVNAYGSTNSYPATLTVSSSSSCYPAPSGIVAWWPGEGNTDDIINGNDGVVTNGTVGYAPAEVGLGFNFDGGPNRLIVPDSPSLDIGSNVDFTIETWIRAFPTNTPQGVMSICDKRYAPSNTQCQGYEVSLLYGQLNLRISDDSSGNGNNWSAGPNLLDGQLHHIAVSVSRDSTDGGNLYVDGTNVLQFDPTSVEGNLTTSEPLRIGNHPDPTYMAFFDGQIDELSIYKRALSSSEIAAIYQAGSAGKCPPITRMAPYIIVPPANQTVTEGGTATFSVTAGGTAPLSYDWYFNGTNLVGTNATLTLGDVSLAEAGVYQVFVSNAYGSTNSPPATLTVNSSGPSQAPYIIAQPGDQVVTLGGTATFSVTAGGAAPLSYDWIFDGTNSVGTNATLVLDDVTPANAGVYQVFIENAYGSTNSRLATLTINSSGPVTNVPVITSFSPTLGATGTVVNINGLNFSPVAGDNIVYFGAVRATVQGASRTNMQVKVPAGATFAPITETVNGLTAYANQPFLPTFSGSAPANFSLGPQLVMSASNMTWFVVIADLDGDGKPDLAINNGDGHTIDIYRNISAGGTLTAASFAPPVILPIGTGGQNAMVAADLTGDGKLDLICLDDNSNLVMVLKNLSTPGSITANSFAPAVNFAVGVDPRGVAVRDLNGDGKPEIVVANCHDSTLSVLRNVSTPGTINSSSFVPAGVFPTGLNPQNVMIADIDGDGQPDLVTVNNNYSGSTSSLSVLRNISTPTNIAFAGDVDFPGLQDTYCLAIGDVDGDGKPDVVLGSQPGGQSISIYRNTSTPGVITTNSFAPEVNFAAGGWVNSVALGDLNGDGKLDVAAALQLPSQMDVFLNQSTRGSISNNSFAAPLVFASGYNANGIAIGDLNGDGMPDVAFANSYDGTISIYQNTTTLGGGTNVTTSTLDHFAWNPILSPQSRLTPFMVTITARDAANNIVTNFTGKVSIFSSNGIPVLPSTSGNFVRGMWAGLDEVPLAASNVVLTATDGLGHSGSSNPFNVMNRPVLISAPFGNRLQIGWSAGASGFVLEMTTNLGSGNWIPVPGQPLQFSNLCLEPIGPAMTNSQVFYRLQYIGQ